VERTWTKREAVVAFRNPNFNSDKATDVIVYLQGDTCVKCVPRDPTLTLSVGKSVGLRFRIDGPQVLLKKIRVKAADLGADEWTDLRLAMDQSFVPKNLYPPLNDDARELGFSVHNLCVVDAAQAGSPEGVVDAVALGPAGPGPSSSPEGPGPDGVPAREDHSLCRGPPGRLFTQSPPGASPPPTPAGSTLRLVCLALLALHLGLSPLLFSVSTHEAFEFPKLLLLIATCAIVGTLVLSRPTGALGTRSPAEGHRRGWRDPVVVGLAWLAVSGLVSTASSVSVWTSLAGEENSFAGLPTLLAYVVLFSSRAA